MGLLQRSLISKQFWGDLETFCKKCKQKRTMKFFDNGNYTIKCKCGCDILTYHEPDENHVKAYYLRSFIPKGKFVKGFNKRTDAERLGFKLINGKLVK